jgi:hypothetical protein
MVNHDTCHKNPSCAVSRTPGINPTSDFRRNNLGIELLPEKV